MKYVATYSNIQNLNVLIGESYRRDIFSIAEDTNRFEHMYLAAKDSFQKKDYTKAQESIREYITLTSLNSEKAFRLYGDICLSLGEDTR